MLREGITFSRFAAIAQMAFVESAAKDFAGPGMKSSMSSISSLTGLSITEVNAALLQQEKFEASEIQDDVNSCVRVLHGWHNDRAYVGPYGFPIDLPFVGNSLSFSRLAAHHAPGIAPEIILQELKRVGAVTEVGANIWKALKPEYIEPSLSPSNLSRMASLVAALLATLENNTRVSRDETDLFERTVVVHSLLSKTQLLELQSYLKTVGGQFLQRVDAFTSVELHEKTELKPGEIADIRAGLQCFLFVEPPVDDIPLRNAIEHIKTTH